MLEIINNLIPFFEDNYERIHVREYARRVGVSPPTASQRLKNFSTKGLLNVEEGRNIIYYYANRECSLFIDLLRMYWRTEFKKMGLIEYLEEELINPLVILFGSFSKAEISEDSDIDIVIFTPTSKELDFGRFEKRLHRKIQPFIFKSRSEVKNKELLNNFLNGYILTGSW